MSYIHSLLSVIILSFSLIAFSADADQVLGVWWSPEQKTKVKISKNDNIYYGRIIAVRPESKDLLDTHHPDESLRKRQILGLEILSGLKFDGDETWEKGSIYDPENGKIYKCKMWFDKNDVLKIRGYIGFSLLGRTVEFTKVTGPNPESQQEGEPIKVHLPVK